MAEVLRDQVVHILHTYEGSRIAMNCIWFGSKKVLSVLFFSEFLAVEMKNSQ